MYNRSLEEEKAKKLMQDIFNLSAEKMVVVSKVKLLLTVNIPKNMVYNPTDEEFAVAIDLAIQSINMKKPVSTLTFDNINGIEVLRGILVLWTGYWVIENIISKWVGVGRELEIEGLNAIDRLERYRSLRDDIKSDLDQATSDVKKGLGIGAGSRGAITVSTYGISTRSGRCGRSGIGSVYLGKWHGYGII